MQYNQNGPRLFLFSTHWKAEEAGTNTTEGTSSGKRNWIDEFVSQSENQVNKKLSFFQVWLLPVGNTHI